MRLYATDYSKYYELYYEFDYKAANWEKAHRVFCRWERDTGEMLLRFTFFVTTMVASAKKVFQTYNQRGDNVICHTLPQEKKKKTLLAPVHTLSTWLTRFKWEIELRRNDGNNSRRIKGFASIGAPRTTSLVRSDSFVRKLLLPLGHHAPQHP